MTENVVLLAGPEVWATGHGPNHPLKPQRLQRTYELLEAYGAFDLAGLRLRAPRQVQRAQLGLFHRVEYIEAVHSLSAGRNEVNPARYNFGPGDNPVFSGMFESEGLKVGSAMQAAELIHREQCRVAFSYSGGLHHGGPDFASGFCVFNDIAVALTWLVQQGHRPLYVDVDVHHGDGVQAAFYDSDQVMTISLHQDPRTLFPGTGFVYETGSGAGEGYAVNLPLPPGTDDPSYLDAFQRVVPPLLARFDPDLLVTQLGVDTHHHDPLAQLALTTSGQEQLFRYFASVDLPWLAFGGGGYNMDVVPRAWTLAVGAMLDHEFADELPAAYRRRYGASTLHDPERLAPPAPASVRHVLEQRARDLLQRLAVK